MNYISRIIAHTLLATMVGVSITRNAVRRVFKILTDGRGVASALVPLCLIGVLYGPLVGIAAAPGIEQPTLIMPLLELTLPKLDGIPETELVPAPQPVPKRKFKAVLTQYSRADSCHNIKNGKCLMASGKPVYEGAVACPYFLALGSKVLIDGEIYTCEDRYAVWLDDMRGLPTIDVFVDSNPRGRSVATVGVI